MKARIMAKTALGVGLCLSVAACAPDALDEAQVQEWNQQSSQLADRFQAQLKGELVGALSNAGAAGAIGVCQAAAPAIAQNLSEESGAQIRRIARKNRNPGNAMEEELEALYRELETQPIKDGAPRAVHASFEDRFIYMRAIVMQEKPCATCHGQNVEPALKAVIQDAYPDDRAIGFTPGQLRGAFVVEHVISK